MSKTTQQIMLLLLIIVLGNVAYWALNKKFLHEEVIAMITGKPSSPPLVLEPEPEPVPTNQADSVIEQASSDTISDDPIELINTIAGLEADISNLEMQADEISQVVDELADQTQLTDLKIEEIKTNFGLSDEQLQTLLAEANLDPLNADSSTSE